MSPEEIEDIYYDQASEVAGPILLGLAGAGDSVAQLFLGHLCDEETPSNQEGAIAWYRKSSDGGYLEGTHYLASFLYYGFGAQQDIEQALRLFESAATAGLDVSQWKLGQHLLSVPERRDDAIRWLQSAALQGHSTAIEMLASISNDKSA